MGGRLRAGVFAVLLGLGLSGPASAAGTAYVTDTITVAVFPAADLKGEPLERLISGALVDVLETGKGVTRIRTGAGKTGWLRTTFLTTNLPVSIRLEAADNKLGKLNQQLDQAQIKIRQLEKEAAKAKDLVWMRAELKKARNRAKALETDVRKYKDQLAALATEADASVAADEDSDTGLQDELLSLQAQNADLEQRLAATLMINSEVDLMADPSTIDETPAWLTNLPWWLGGLCAGLLLGAWLGYRYLARQIQGRYVKVY